MNFLHHLKALLLRSITYVGSLVTGEFPFIVIFLICILPATLKVHISYFFQHLQFNFYQFYLLAIFYTLFAAFLAHRFKIAKVIFYSIGVFLFAFFAVVWLLFRACISPQIILLILETNYREATEFLSAYAFSRSALLAYLCIAVIVIFLFMVERWWQRGCLLRNFISTPTLKKMFGVIGIILFLMGMYQCHIFYRMTQCNTSEELDAWTQKHYPIAMDAVTALTYSLYAPTTVANEISIAINYAKKISQSPLQKYSNAEKQDSLFVVYILGESYIKHHASLYGYPRKTTPFMDNEEKKGNLVAFTDVVTPFNLTTFAQKNTFCCNSLSDGEVWYKSAFFPILFKKAQYKVTFWDNQRYIDLGGFYTFSANSFFYNPSIIKYAYDKLSDNIFEYDGQLIDDYLKGEARKPVRLNLNMFHLIGQHVDFTDRYPHTKEYLRFDETDCPNHASYITPSMRTEIAHYDNATYYNDCVINKLATWYKDKPTVMVYISDHGEEVYDYRSSKGRSGATQQYVAQILKYQYEIPCIVWFSDIFKKRYPEIVKATQQAKDKPFSSDNICQLVFHLASLHTPWHRPERCPMCSAYSPKHRIIMGMDYDKIVKGRQK